MEVKNRKKKNKMVLPEGVERIFERKSKETAEKNLRNNMPRLFKRAVFCGSGALLILYFCLPFSSVNSISVSGQQYLSSAYIRKQAALDLSARYYLTIPILKEMKLKQDPFIADARVSLEDNRAVSIVVKEKKAVGYSYDEDTPYVYFTDGSRAELTSDNLDIISEIPMISGFDEEEQRRKLCNAFEDLKPEVINNISEVTRYELEYDADTVKILMRTGGYFLTNYHDLHLLNSYNKIINRVTDQSLCVFAFGGDEEDTVYTKVCPWNQQEDTTEYWTDDAGNVIKNEYGDKVAKHYYTTEDGKDALDENGQKIPIPLDDKGHENPDADFIEHYKAGYYASGKLVIPADQ